MKRRLPPALQIREFAHLWVAIASMRFGENMIAVAVGWQVYAIRRNPLDLGLIGLAEFIPLPLLALPAGQLADRMSRRLLASIALMVNIAVVLLLLLVTANGADELWPFFALAAANGVASSIGWPAFNALTPELVPPDLLPGAVALRSVAGQAAVVVGPAIGGLLFAWRPELVYAVSAGLFAVALVAVFSLRRAKLQVAASGEAPGFDSLVAGIRFVLRTRIVLGAISLDLFAVLLGGGIALLPVYAREILHTGPVGLGVLRTAPALGALTAAVLLTRRPLRWPAGPTLIVAVAIFGLATVVWGLSAGSHSRSPGWRSPASWICTA